MEYEEYLAKVLEDESNIEHIATKVGRNYYPFTTQCPKDGKTCAKETCREYRDEQCLHFEMHRMMYNVFGTGDKWVHFNIDLGVKDNWLDWRIRYNSLYPREKGGINRIAFTIGTEHGTISSKVLKEVGLGEYLTDDWEYSSTAEFPEVFESLSDIQAFLELVKSKKDELEELYVKYHTCVRCKKIDSYGIMFYDPIGICGACIGEITEQWLKDEGFEVSESG